MFSFNRYLVIGFFLLVLGFLLLPVGIGLLIMPIGALILVLGVHLTIWRLIPGHKAFEPKIKKFFQQYIESSTILKIIFRKN